MFWSKIHRGVCTLLSLHKLFRGSTLKGIQLLEYFSYSPLNMWRQHFLSTCKSLSVKCIYNYCFSIVSSLCCSYSSANTATHTKARTNTRASLTDRAVTGNGFSQQCNPSSGQFYSTLLPSVNCSVRLCNHLHSLGENQRAGPSLWPHAAVYWQHILVHSQSPGVRQRWISLHCGGNQCSWSDCAKLRSSNNHSYK